MNIEALLPAQIREVIQKIAIEDANGWLDTEGSDFAEEELDDFVDFFKGNCPDIFKQVLSTSSEQTFLMSEKVQAFITENELQAELEEFYIATFEKQVRERLAFIKN